ncbi:MAG: hypothetical protein J3R72DRAFT_422589 [Linnemannia gamsii]|nr:MAG: hypothetical protein J3R72DRAFT_422589 [Linnemannia gamsii]
MPSSTKNAKKASSSKTKEYAPRVLRDGKKIDNGAVVSEASALSFPKGKPSTSQRSKAGKPNKGSIATEVDTAPTPLSDGVDSSLSLGSTTGVVAQPGSLGPAPGNQLHSQSAVPFSYSPGFGYYSVPPGFSQQPGFHHQPGLPQSMGFPQQPGHSQPQQIGHPSQHPVLPSQQAGYSFQPHQQGFMPYGLHPALLAILISLPTTCTTIHRSP